MLYFQGKRIRDMNQEQLLLVLDWAFRKIDELKAELVAKDLNKDA